MRHRVVGLPDPLPLRRVTDTDLWYVTTELPEGSRIEYQFEITRDGHTRVRSSTTRSTPGSRTVRSGRARCARPPATTCPTGRSTTRRPARGGRRAEHRAARRCAVRWATSSTCRPGSATSCATRCSSSTTGSTTSTTPRPRPCSTTSSTATRSPRWSSRSSPARRPARRVRQPRAARPLRRTRAGAASSPTSCRWSTARSGAPHGVELRRRRVAVDGRALPRRLRVAAARVAVARLHRHRSGPRRRTGLRPGGEVRQPLPRAAAARSPTGST